MPGKSHEWRSLVGYSPWGRKESDTTEQLYFTSLQIYTHTHTHTYGTMKKNIYTHVWEPQDRRLERQEPLTTPGPQDIHKLLSTALGVLKVP